MTVNAITVDVEDYFQVEAFAGVLPRAAWETMPRRVEANTERLLQIFDSAGVHGTFFTLGWIAERHPELVRRIVAGGHELASHGYGHARVDTLGPAAFAADIHRAKALLEDVSGNAVHGYRAPTFSIGPRTPWAAHALAEAGHLYSSSVYPVRHDLYGDPTAQRTAFRVADGALWEIPMSTARIFGKNLPVSGGGFFRLLPYQLFKLGLRRVNKVDLTSGVFYIHPWEVDPAQPRIAAGALSRFRHYTNLHRTAPRLEKLLRDFKWDRMDRVFPFLVANR